MGLASIAATAGAHSFLNITTNASTAVKSTSGILHTLTVGTIGTTSTITIFDNTSAAGTKIGTFSSVGVANYILDASFSIGLFIVTAGAAAADITVTYR